MDNSLLALLATSASANGATNYSEDVFLTNLRDGTGATTTVTGGPDLATYGGFVITKARDTTTTWAWTDTLRGPTKSLNSALADAEITESTGLTSFTTSGVVYGNSTKYNAVGYKFVDYIFRKAPKFMDIVSYTGNGSARTIPHTLGSTPGLIIVKRTDASSPWLVYMGGTSGSTYMYAILNESYSYGDGNSIWNYTLATSSEFSLGTNPLGQNTNGVPYVAYLFANNTSAEGLIRTETMTTSFVGNGEVNLGWEPQFLLMNNVSKGSDWLVVDSNRGFPAGNTRMEMSLNDASAVEVNAGNNIVEITNTGFKITSGGANADILWLAVRKPNKPVNSGLKVYNAIARTGTGSLTNVTGLGFAPDMVMGKSRSVRSGVSNFTSKICGVNQELLGHSTAAEATYSNDLASFLMDGFSVGTGASGNKNTGSATYIEHCFKRAFSVFDIVVDVGNGAAHTIPHQLGVIPELMIRKCRSTTSNWLVYHSALGNTQSMVMNSTAAAVTPTRVWNYTTPTNTDLSVGADAAVNTLSASYVTYLFATLSGVSKVGSFTGNSGSQTINCGFTAGARFVLIKRINAAGDWFVWDSVRGITAGGNDPHISINTTSTEVTTDSSIEPDSSGFTVNQVAATSMNIIGSTYLFLAIA